MGAALATPEPLLQEQLVLIEAAAGKKRNEKRGGNKKRRGGYVKREERVRDLLETLTRHEWPSVRPDWLVNPRTGKRMEIDCFCSQLKVCVEVDGAHHWGRVAFMQSEQEYQDQRPRDHTKDRIVELMGYSMIRVPPRHVLDDSQLALYLTQQLGKYVFSIKI